jgi:hypothetical protein
MPEATFKTPHEAVAYRAPRNHELKRDIASLKGNLIEDGSWTDSTFTLRFSEERELYIALERDKVTWEVRKSLAKSSIPTNARDVALIEMTSESDPKIRESTWDRETLLSERVGKTFLDLYAGQAWLWLYTEAQPTLCFTRLIQLESREDLLHWSETE